MTAKRTDDTAQELKSTPAEIAAKTHPVRPDAKGKLLDRQRAAAKDFQASKAETPKPKRRTISLQTSCRNFPEAKAWFIRSTLRREAGEHAIYSLSSYHGTVEALPGIIEKHVRERIPLARQEQQFRELLLAHKQTPIPAPSIIVQKISANPQVPGELIPQLRRSTGPSDFQQVVATIVLLRSLEAVTNRAAILAVKSECVRLDIQLLEIVKSFRPFDRPGVKPEDNPSTMLYDDSGGKRVYEARMRLAAATEVVRQRERLREYHTALKKKHRWLVEILAAVDKARDIQVDEQKKLDRAAQRTEALAMIAASYETDHKGLRWDRYLSEQERTELADRKTEMERDLSEAKK